MMMNYTCMYVLSIYSRYTVDRMMLLLYVCEVGSSEGGECSVGADGGRRRGITTTADGNLTYNNVICRAARSTGSGRLMVSAFVAMVCGS